MTESVIIDLTLKLQSISFTPKTFLAPPKISIKVGVCSNTKLKFDLNLP